ncbi:NAD-dependent epimerase/dehydratase family protein [Candidatus Pelagibacter sp.]|nr:NAD-dependent epimerase/dehydratase family protein [Candidatus Pelagibacter sp.]
MKNNFRYDLVKNYLKKIKIKKKIKDYFVGKNILVTGGAGAIGSNLVIALSQLVGEKGIVIILDNLTSIKGKNPIDLPSLQNIMFVKGDIRNDTDLKRVFREKPTIVFHLAAFFANQNSVDYPENSAEVDVNGLIKLLDLSQFTNVERFIYASSGCSIYGSYGKMPLKEDFMSMHLTTPYQINKMVGEMYSNFYFHHYGLKIVNCRFFNSFGPGEVPGQYRNVIPNFIYWSMLKKSLPLTGTGNETRDFTYVLDLVQGLIKAAYYKEAIGKAFNLAAGREIKIKDVIKSINESTKNSEPITKFPSRKWDTKKRLLASIDLANDLIDYKPAVNFKDGLKANFEWFNNNWTNIKSSADFPVGMSSAIRKK